MWILALFLFANHTVICSAAHLGMHGMLQWRGGGQGNDNVFSTIKFCTSTSGMNMKFVVPFVAG